MNYYDNANTAHPISAAREQGLCDFINAMPEPAHLKDPSSGKYLFSNQSNLGIYGLEHVDEIIGKTVQDLDVFMKVFWGVDFAKEVNALDQGVFQNGVTMTDDHRVFLDCAGLVHIQNMVKTPIFTEKKKVAAILTLSFDLTQKTDLVSLFKIYKRVYTKKSVAMTTFVKHIQLDHIFKEPLTEKEILCLLYLKRNRGYKNIAAQLNVGLKTVETHMSHIIQKAGQHTMSDILVLLLEGKS
jgi:DNA-binding CsgD family transcriptional regulator